MNNAGPLEQLRDPEFWEEVAERIGEHPYIYDMDDDSHRLDVVQIVLTAAAKELEESE